MIGRGQIAAAPIGGSRERPPAVVVDHHEARQALVFRAESVGHPAAHAGMPHQHRAGVPLVVGQDVVVRAALAGVHKRQVVRHRAHVREEFGDELAALAVALELERAAHQRAGEALPHSHLALARQRLAMVLFEHRLVVERVHVADTAAHE